MLRALALNGLIWEFSSEEILIYIFKPIFYFYYHWFEIILAILLSLLLFPIHDYIFYILYVLFMLRWIGVYLKKVV